LRKGLRITELDCDADAPDEERECDCIAAAGECAIGDTPREAARSKRSPRAPEEADEEVLVEDEEESGEDDSPRGVATRWDKWRDSFAPPPPPPPPLL
jgi:hypothetical protein